MPSIAMATMTGFFIYTYIHSVLDHHPFYLPTHPATYLPVCRLSRRIVVVNSYARLYPSVGLDWVGFFFPCICYALDWVRFFRSLSDVGLSRGGKGSIISACPPTYLPACHIYLLTNFPRCYFAFLLCPPSYVLPSLPSLPSSPNPVVGCGLLVDNSCIIRSLKISPFFFYPFFFPSFPAFSFSFYPSLGRDFFLLTSITLPHHLLTLLTTITLP